MLDQWRVKRPAEMTFALAAIPAAVLDASTREACLSAIADELGEMLEDKRALIERVVHLMGWRRTLELLAHAIEADRAGGVWSVAMKARRTKGGLFFSLLPDNKRWRLERRAPPRSPPPTPTPPAAPAPTAEPPPRTPHGKRGKIIVTPKLVLMGRPAFEGVVERDKYVSFALDYEGAPSLPKDLPVFPKGVITYTVYLARKKWCELEPMLRKDETDQLVLEGFPCYDADLEGPALWVQSATTREERRQKFAKAAPPTGTTEGVAGAQGVRRGEAVIERGAGGASPEVMIVTRRSPSS
jgi:hypothetical protein